MRRATIPNTLLVAALLATPSTAQKAAKAKKWDLFPDGWTLKTKAGTFHTTLDKAELPKIAARIAELQPAYSQHFGTRSEPGWVFVVLQDRAEYTIYARKVTRGQTAVQGQCFRDQKIVSVCNSARYGWRSTLSHEYGHAYYDCRGPIWLREGIASLVEVAEIHGKGKQARMVIPVNQPRLRGLRLHQRGKHYRSILHLARGAKEPDGYGYSYEHGWSLHYFLYQTNPDKYGAFLGAVRNKTGPDLSADLEKFFGMKLEALDQAWIEFVAKLK